MKYNQDKSVYLYKQSNENEIVQKNTQLLKEELIINTRIVLKNLNFKDRM